IDAKSAKIACCCANTLAPAVGHNDSATMPTDARAVNWANPNPDFSFHVRLARRIGSRAMLVWVAVHLIVALVSSGDLLGFTPIAALLLILIGGALGVIDSRRRNEVLFSSNLG